MHLSNDDVAAIVNEVWSSMLGLPVDPLELEERPTIEGPAVSGSVGVNGATDCLICVEMGSDAARLFGSTMFGLAEDEASEDDISDAVGELTNMVGGNIKSLLPEPSTLSLPVVAQGEPPAIKVIGGETLIAQPFACGEGYVVVSVWNREAK